MDSGRFFRHFGLLAQLVERRPVKSKWPGSSPGESYKNFVLIPKGFIAWNVAGSSPAKIDKRGCNSG